MKAIDSQILMKKRLNNKNNEKKCKDEKTRKKKQLNENRKFLELHTAIA